MVNLFYTILSTNQVVLLCTSGISHPSVSLQWCSQAPYTQQKMRPSSSSDAHHEDRRRCSWEATLLAVSPSFLPISPGRAKPALPGGMSTEFVPGRISGGWCIPRLLYRWRQHDRAHDALAFRTEVSDETDPLGHRGSLRWRRHAPRRAPSVEEVCHPIKNIRAAGELLLANHNYAEGPRFFGGEGLI